MKAGPLAPYRATTTPGGCAVVRAGGRSGVGSPLTPYRETGGRSYSIP